MKIGEFAKTCSTRVSVLRHYEKQGVLLPDHIDRFTGYRYYAPEQLAVFFRIQCLKQAGFSLEEIRTILSSSPNNQQLLVYFDRKEQALLQSLQDLQQAKKIFLGGNKMTTLYFDNQLGQLTAHLSKTDSASFDILCQELQNQLASLSYQRISPFSSCEDSICCGVLHLNSHAKEQHDNIDLPFVPDEDLIGRWEVLGEFVNREEFLRQPQLGKTAAEIGDIHREIYFLPDGQRYWCYGWTRGALLIDDGRSTFCNSYTKEKINGETHLFVDFKSYDYCRGGKTTVLVLHQLDKKHYNAQELSRKDDIDLSFVPDDAILGEWTACGFCQNKELFDPTAPAANLFWSKVCFLPNGSCTLVYENETISGDQQVSWTKGVLLRHFNHCACAYELRRIQDTEYLFIEWKSGDWRWGGFDTDYYVFTRSQNH